MSNTPGINLILKLTRELGRFNGYSIEHTGGAPAFIISSNMTLHLIDRHGHDRRFASGAAVRHPIT